jgi:hypothetical protein
MQHVANEQESKLVDEISSDIREEFCLIRITHTMLVKSTIDANISILKMFEKGDFFDYTKAVDGEKHYKNSEVLTEDGWVDRNTSFYRPKAKPGKPGDPRFWPSVLNQVVNEGDLVYVSVVKQNLIIIPLRSELLAKAKLAEKFGSGLNASDGLDEVIAKLKELSGKWIKSCSPLKSSPKDVGDTLEAEFDLPINNLGTADFHGIELKTKRSASKTADTLFSQVPNPDLSPLKTAREIIRAYGYPSRHAKRVGFHDLFVTVANKPNPQGLYLVVNSDDEVVEMRCTGSAKIAADDHLVAVWDFELLEKRLFEKHPTTAWIIAHEEKIAGEIHFKYDRLEVSQTPIFSQFLFLIERGVVVFDWRGGYHPTDGGRVDKGHPFRLKGAKNRKLLFGTLEVVDLTV